MSNNDAVIVGMVETIGRIADTFDAMDASITSKKMKVVNEFLNKVEAANNKCISRSSNAARRGSRMYDNKAIRTIRELLSSSSSEQKNGLSDGGQYYERL